MIRNSIARCHSGSPDAEAVAGEVTWDVCRCQDLLKPVLEHSVWKRLPIPEQKQGTWDVTPENKILYHRVDSAEQGLAKADVDKGAFPK